MVAPPDRMLVIRSYVAGDSLLPLVPPRIRYRKTPVGFESRSWSLRLGPVAYTQSITPTTRCGANERRCSCGRVCAANGAPVRGRNEPG